MGLCDEARDAWFRETFPNDLGEDHRWSWLVRANAEPGDGKDILWLHRCKEGRFVTCWIDLTSGKKHRLVSEEPLHVEASIGCPLGCGDHGFIRDGKWARA